MRVERSARNGTMSVIHRTFSRSETAAPAPIVPRTDQLRNASTKGMDVSMTLLEFVTSIGDRWARGLDPTSTGETYGYGLKLRVLPALGYLPVTQITAGIIDRTIDEWEQRHGASPIKNTIAPLVRVLDEAVRDGLIQINPAKNRAKRSLNGNAFRGQSAEQSSPAGARDPRHEDPQPARQGVRQGPPVLQRLRDARRAAGGPVLGGIRIAGRGRGLW